MNTLKAIAVIPIALASIAFYVSIPLGGMYVNYLIVKWLIGG